MRVMKDRLGWWKVIAKAPNPDDVGTLDVEIEVQYRLLGRKEMSEALLKGLNLSEQSDDAAKLEALRQALAPEARQEADDWLAGHIRAWRNGLEDEEGNPLPCHAETLALVMDIPYLRQALDRGLWDASRAAPAGN